MVIVPPLLIRRNQYVPSAKMTTTKTLREAPWAFGA